MTSALLADYYALTKPGIVWGNTLTAAAGFFLASQGAVAWGTLLAALLGIALVVASACAFNNYIDLPLDRRMERTRARPLVRGSISEKAALIFAGALLALGSAFLFLWTAPLSLAAALAGFALYIGPYTLAKRMTPYGMHIGALAGAMPPVAGYLAVAGYPAPAGAAALFLILALWQMPHFFAITLYRAEEYAAAGLPVFPLRYGAARTKLLTILYIAAFALASVLPYTLELASASYLALSALAGLGWLGFSLITLRRYDDRQWARRVFFASLAALLAWCAAVFFT